MTDYTKLVEALRCGEYKPECGSSDCPYWSGLGCMDGQLMEDAAAAIEALQAEADKANKSADDYRAMYFAKHGDITIEKVRELDEIDCHFHSALIRLMYKRIEELESDLQAQLPKRGEIVRCGECKHHEDEEPGMVYCPKIVGSWVSENWYCADGEREVQE